MEAIMRQSLLLALTLLVLPVAGCGEREPLAPLVPQDVAGLWTGTITFQLQGGIGIGVGATDPGRLDEVEVILSEDALGQITGAGAFLSSRARRGTLPTLGTPPAPAARAVEVRGTHTFPTLVLTLRSGTELAPGELVYLRGEFVGVDRVSAQLLGGEFNNDRVELRRVPRPVVVP
jgi:hypothetical protein